MNEKNTPHPLLAQGEGQVNGLSNSDYTTANAEKQSFIFDMLPQGEGNAVTTNALVKLTGYKSARDLQNKIAAEREQGYLILSTCRNGGGYFRPADGEQGQQEIARFIQTLKARAINTLVAIKAARKALAQAEGQITLNGLEGL